MGIIKLFVLIALLQACDDRATGDNPEKAGSAFETKTILKGYEIIWGMDFLPGGDLIFTDKRGKIYRKNGENVTEITGFPKVYDEGQGGLLDIRVHPGYSENGWIYASFSEEGQPGVGRFRLIRFRIQNNQVSNIEDIFTTDASNSWHGHYGSRIEFDNANHVFFSIGEGGNTTYAGPNSKNNNARNPASPWGKIHRLMDDGRIPGDNPVIEGNKEPTSVYSYGHRNPQGMMINPADNELWITEHGPKGGDEINIIVKGANYGWPVYSLGVNYDGTTISQGHNAKGIKEPVFHWTPSIGACGMTFVSGSKLPSLEGNLLVCGLASRKLHRCVINNGKITEEEPVLTSERARMSYRRLTDRYMSRLKIPAGLSRYFQKSR